MSEPSFWSRISRRSRIDRRVRFRSDRARVVSERGSATVLAVVLVGVLTVVALAAVTVGGLLIGQRRAASAADLAALAAAQRLVAEPGAVARACEKASAVSRSNGAHLSRCDAVSTTDVQVVVEVAVRGPFGLAWTVSQEARAGQARGPTPSGLPP